LGKGLIGDDGNAARNCETAYVCAIKKRIGSDFADWKAICDRRDDDVPPGPEYPVMVIAPLLVTNVNCARRTNGTSSETKTVAKTRSVND